MKMTKNVVFIWKGCLKNGTRSRNERESEPLSRNCAKCPAFILRFCKNTEQDLWQKGDYVLGWIFAFCERNACFFDCAGRSFVSIEKNEMKLMVNPTLDGRCLDFNMTYIPESVKEDVEYYLDHNAFWQFNENCILYMERKLEKWNQ